MQDHGKIVLPGHSHGGSEPKLSCIVNTEDAVSLRVRSLSHLFHQGRNIEDSVKTLLTWRSFLLLQCRLPFHISLLPAAAIYNPTSI